MSLQHVLLVDDEPDIRTLVTLILQRMGGMTVRAAASGQEALDLLGADYRPDLILLDVMMPGMDGIETLAAIRSMRTVADLPVCFFTAKVHPAELQQWRDLGVDAVLAKPFSPAELVAQLREIWSRLAPADAA